MSHRVHGLTGESAQADWPPLTAGELVTVLACYGLDAPQGSPWISPRPLSSAACVQAGTRQVFVKRHPRDVRNAPALREEHRFIAHLRARGIPVPQVLTRPDGDSVFDTGTWTYELHALAAGDDRYRQAHSWTPPRSLSDARAAGSMLARLHQASQGYAAPQRSTHILVARDELLRDADVIGALEAQLASRPALASFLATRRWQNDLQADVLPLHALAQPELAGEPRLWTHNDWHVSNLFWHDDHRVAAVVDFGLASPNFALYDLATAIERNAIAWLDLVRGDESVHARVAEALITGYRDETPLHARDLHVLARLLPVVHLDFALSEIEYFHGILASRERAELAYAQFLLGHARWFRQASGQRLLECIEALA